MARSRARIPEARRQRASHSMEAVLDAAVALLDEAGESALTFRALASRLGGGVGSVYWYVAGREELLDRASDHVLAAVVAEVERHPDSDDPIADLRAIALQLFDVVVQRPWLAAYYMRNTDAQPQSLRLFELLGQQVLRLHLTPRQSFYAVSAVVGFVIGTAADLGQQPPREVLDGELTSEEYLAWYVDQWRELDPARYPYIHFVVDEFADHDDTEQFRAGLDLLLTGLRRQAGLE